MDFINEVIQLPVLLNQKTLCKTTYIEDACFASRFFSVGENVKARGLDKSSDLQDLKSKVIQSILLVLEGNDRENYEDLQTKLDPEFLIQFAKDIALTQGLKTDEPTLPNHLQQIMDVYIIIKKVESKTPCDWAKQVTQLLERDEDPLVRSIYRFFQLNLKQIEIHYEGDMQMVFFPYHPVFKFLSEETKDKIMDTISRDTQREKLIGLQKLFETIKSEIEYNFFLNAQTIPITHKTIARLTNLAQTISLLVNVFLVHAVVVVIKDQQSSYVIEDYKQHVLQLLGTIQLLVSLLAFILFVISRAPLEVKDLNPLMADLKLGPIAFIKSLLKRLLLIFTGDEFLQHFIFVGISYIGVTVDSYYFSLHMFYLFARLELLRSVFQAISYNASQLLLVSGLGVLF